MIEHLFIDFANSLSTTQRDLHTERTAQNDGPPDEIGHALTPHRLDLYQAVWSGAQIR